MKTKEINKEEKIKETYCEVNEEREKLQLRQRDE